MTQITPKLGLLLYDIGVPDNQATFLQFRSDLAGVSGSNFIKIDDAVADIDDRLTAVENLKPIVKLEGITTDGANYIATNPSVTTLYNGFIIDFIPNQDNTGTATLTINGGAINTINKISSSGTVVNLDARDLMALRRYILEYTGTEWILVNATSADQVNVIGTPGSILVVDVDNSIASSSIPVVDNKISGDNIKTNPADIFSDNGALSLTDTLSETGIYKGIEWDSTGRAVNVATNKVLPSDISLDASLTDNSGALGLSPTGIAPGVYKGTEYDKTGRAIGSVEKIIASEIKLSPRLVGSGQYNTDLDLSLTGIASGIYKGLTLDAYGRVIGTNNLVRGDEIRINNSLISTEGVLGVSKAPDSDRLGGQLPSYYLPATGKSADSDKLDGVDLAAFKGLDSLSDPNADRVLFWDESAGALKWLTVDGIVGTDLGKWQAYTPIWTAITTNPSIGNGTLVGRYCVVGKTVTVTVRLIIGSTTNCGSGYWYFSLPLTSANNSVYYLGSLFYLDYSSNTYKDGIVYVRPNLSETTTFIVAESPINRLADTIPITWASGDELEFTVAYEIA